MGQQAPKTRIKPPKMKRKEPPTLERMLAEIRKGFSFQLNTFLVQFTEANSDEDIEAFLPEDVGEADKWIESHISKFVENEDPSPDEMIDGVAAIFMMAFLERLYAHCGIGSEDDAEDVEDDAEDEDEDDAEDEAEDEDDTGTDD